MLKRMTLGALKGGLLGVLIALLLVFGLKVTATGAALAYVLAVATGAVAGLVTGKPIWAPDAKIEAGIKGFFGALLGAGILFALRKWLPLNVDFSAFNAGQGALGELPAAYVPIVAGVLGLVFELDNTGQKPDQSAAQKRVAGSRTEQRRVAEADADPMLEAEMDPERAQRRHER